MRIVNWDELKILPEGTIIQMIGGNGGYLSEPMVFGGATSPHAHADFVEASFLPSINFAGTQGDSKPSGVDENDMLVFQPSGFGRYGLYDLEDGTHRWVVWEDADRQRMARWLLNPVECLNDQNADEFAYVAVVLP